MYRSAVLNFALEFSLITGVNLQALILGIESKDYTQIRNTLLVLIKVRIMC